jgi:hypothetical protein
MKNTITRGVLAATVLVAVLSRAETPDPLSDVRVFAVYEPVFTRQDVELLTRVRPDFVCRGWFKWHHTPDWQTYAPLARACAEKGIRLQGGITLSAIYPGENGIDDATFRDFVSYCADGQPVHCSFHGGDGWYQLSLYNPKVVDTLKREVRRQIDAGAVGIWYDEVEGYYDWVSTAGYDPYACTAFCDWLIRKYCVGQGWSEDDPRWSARFGVDLSRHGGSMRTFDYRLHLRTTLGKDGKPLAENPPQGHVRRWADSANPLFREWGFAWDRAAAGTFRFDTVAAIFADIVADADRYARERYGRTLINTYNHNGTARPGVAFLQPHLGGQPPIRKGRLDARASYLEEYERIVTDAAEVCPGQPVVFFVDWPSETDRLTALPRSDQMHFFAIYIPEAYAAGGEYALPLRGYSYVAADQGTLAALTRMADFYREYAPFLRGSRVASRQPVAPDRMTLRVRQSAAGTAVHLINHAFSTQAVWPVPRTNLVVTLPWDGPAPTAAFAVSPDFPEQRPVRITRRDDRLELEVGTLVCSLLVLMPEAGAFRAVTGAATDGLHVIAPPSRAMVFARDGRFTLWVPSDATSLECLETGERLPARDGVRFAPPTDGAFASGLLLDGFGIPARHAAITTGTRSRHADAWGRFRIPVADITGGSLSVAVEPGSTNTLTSGDTFTAWRCYAPQIPVLAFPAADEGPWPTAQGSHAPPYGFWANWPDKARVPDVIRLARETHGGRAALRCSFAASPRVAWSNVNSPGFAVAHADAVELVYAGDGTPRTLQAVLHASPRFYRTTISLSENTWTTRRIPLREFRDNEGKSFDPGRHARTVSFQLAPPGALDADVTCWLHRVTLVQETPVRQEWQSATAFDAVDVDNLRTGHLPQRPPPAVVMRQPLVRFSDESSVSRLLANWAGKLDNNTNPMVVVERLAPAGAAAALRVRFPAGTCAWGNVNIPLPIARLVGQDGLAFRMRVSPPEADVVLALHSALKGGEQFFYQSASEVLDGAAEVILPWRDFVCANGQVFDVQATAWVNLQICRPSGRLTRDMTVEIEAVDTVCLRPGPAR